jgi:HK97 gp10 family phage protein
MAKNTSVVTLDTKRLNRILRNLPGNTRDAVGKVAFAVERAAKMKAPVDTGALRASIYTRIGKSGGEAPTGADQVELPQPENNQTAHVGPSVDYGLYVELGTHRMAAQPFLAPAVREVEGELAAMFKDVATDG